MKKFSAMLCLLVAVAGCTEEPGSGPVLGTDRLALTTSCSIALAPTWPTNWQTMSCHGAPATDPVADVSPAVIDAVGTIAFPAVQSALDANFVYLRIRANQSVGPAGCTCTTCSNSFISDAHGWGFDFDTDGNPTTYEFQFLMNGASNQNNRTLEFNQNLVQAGAVDSPNEKAEAVACIYAGSDADARVRVDKTSDSSNLGGDCDFWITLAFPLSELASRGINMKAARLVWAGSSAQAQNLSGDIVCDNHSTPKLSTSSGDPTPLCFNGCCTSDADCTAGHPTTLTTLSAMMTASQTTASVASTTGYPSSGLLVIDSETLQYTGTTANSFTGLTRGALGTTATTHSSGATVQDYLGETHCNTTSGICECATSPDTCPTGLFCDPVMKKCRRDCTAAAPQGGACSTSGDMTLCCDDGNACTTNACTGGKCVFAPTNQGVVCEDHNDCSGSAGTETATCANGVCGSLTVACTDDGLGCTSDVCSSVDLTCLHPVKAAGSVCRAASGSCDVAETCNGTSTSCPANGSAPNGTSCEDGNLCTSGETCTGGVCGAPTSTVSCNSPPSCFSTVGAACNPATGICSYPTSIIGQPCSAGSCNCATAVCDLLGHPAPGVCEAANTCGNGVLEAGEGCDDGGTTSGDGCSAICKVENGFACNANGAGATGSLSCASGICDTVGNVAPGKCEAANTCGNGVLEAGEGCDDGGTTSGDGCNASCKIEESFACNANVSGATGNNSCASGICDTVGNAAPGKCEPVNTCGNSVLEAGEGCDDGGTTSGDGCNASCKIENNLTCNANASGATGNASCASGICDTAGNAAPGKCEAANACGNGVLEAGEGCDDGGTASGDGCNGSCKIENNLACNANVSGATGSASCASGICDTVGNAAPGKCEAANACGNGVLEAGEGCDDGGIVGGDGCDPVCKIETGLPCNANMTGATGNASCESGLCDVTGGAPGLCKATNVCGNGILEPGEGCDDGGTMSGDGCNATCKVENGFACNANLAGATGSASCASSVCDTVGNGAPGVCEPANTCGNGVLEAGEGCDDGGTASGDGCSATCKVDNGFGCNANAAGATGNASCTSGVCDAVGNAGPGLCEAANTCGNGLLEAGEGCDDGNTAASDGCDAGCKIENGLACSASIAGAIGSASCESGICNMAGGAPGICAAAGGCGNGILEAGEGCDDGGIVAGDGCNAMCRVENGASCNANIAGVVGNASCASGVCDARGNGAPGLCEPANTCGNGIVEGGEGCDDGATSGGDGCSPGCLVETGFACNGGLAGATGSASCVSGLCNATGGAPGVCEATNVCGNGLLESGEGCDDGGTASGDGCDGACKVENGFFCNQAAPGQTGSSSCASSVCNVSQGLPGVCAPAGTCGNGLLESGEGCDDGATAGGDGCDASCKVENGSACNANAAGATGSTSCASGRCDTLGNAAPGICESVNTCGNGLLEMGEGCDDGGTAPGDGCDAFCKVENDFSCNANPLGAIGSASCESGLCDSSGGAPGLCKARDVCGNGVLEAGEGCDDGGTANGDGCDASCKVENGFACNQAAPGQTGSGSCTSGVCNLSQGTPGVCEPANTCGNGLLEIGEGCDDGNATAGDGCSAACRVEDGLSCNANPAGLTGSSSCASSVCDTVGNGAPGLCEPASTCGNGLLEAGEGCDDGANTSGDGCNASCKLESGSPCNANASGDTGSASCASGLCDLGGGAPGVCRATNVCGNRVLEAGEGCDDGNTSAGDGCDGACRVENGTACNAAAPGDTGNASCASSVCNLLQGAPGVCAPANACGNGRLEAGEGCDDGNTVPADGCDGACKVENGTACNANVAGATGNASCASSTCDLRSGAPGTCVPANACGNGLLDAGEGCDDGNTTAGDGCNATCQIEEGRSCNTNGAGLTGNSSCASGVCDALGNSAPGICEPAGTCGNGRLEAGEGCDDGGTTGADGCSAGCMVESGFACNADTSGPTGSGSCVSGLCDLSGGAPGICRATNVCGNGTLEAGEGCDDGNTTAGDGCDASCKIENGAACNVRVAGETGSASCASSVCNLSQGTPGVCAPANACGNGKLEAGEGCDDGNMVAGDGCGAGCKVETGRACNANVAGATGGASCASGVCDTTGQPAPGLCEPANTCGNGRLEAGEGCDDGGISNGDGCNASCKLESGSACNQNMAGLLGNASCASGQCNAKGGGPGVCMAHACGNGVLEGGEGCDDGNMAAGDGCNTSCMVETGTPCNGNPVGVTGNASCASSVCDTSGGMPGVCEAANTCGNGRIESGEECDDGNSESGDGCSTACKKEIPGFAGGGVGCQMTSSAGGPQGGLVLIGVMMAALAVRRRARRRMSSARR